tara:strand:+ start:8844 stop:9038 length:195 start_codon:yes stop_codon:yes gene_type:complete
MSDKAVTEMTDDEVESLSVQATIAVLGYLSEHEDDIALGVDDYGKLKDVFIFYTGEIPRPSTLH